MEIITEKNFEEKTKSGVVVVDFFATWCGPCRMLAPTLEELSKEYEGKAKIYKVDVDNDENLARSFGILSIPTLLFFKDGAMKDKHVGYLSKDELVEKIEKLI